MRCTLSMRVVEAARFPLRDTLSSRLHAGDGGHPVEGLGGTLGAPRDAPAGTGDACGRAARERNCIGEIGV
jgi:hypothetical protein